MISLNSDSFWRDEAMLFDVYLLLIVIIIIINMKSEVHANLCNNNINGKEKKKRHR